LTSASRREFRRTGEAGLFVDGETNSSGPCAMLSLSITAKAAATPTPLSEPRVVPSAFSHSPTRIILIGSTSKL